MSSVLARRGKELPEVWSGPLSRVISRLERLVSYDRYFPGKQRYVQLLEANGFKVEEAVLFARDTRCPAGPTGWLEIFGGFLLEGLPESVHKEVWSSLSR